MDLDDLDDLGNHAPVPTRATKFAPKSSKASLKPKSESPLKPKLEEPAPAPEPQRVDAPIPGKKEEAGEGHEEGKDSKPPIVVATAQESEPSTSNGTAPMEVDRKPEGEAVPMDEDGVVDDEVVREIDVYFNPSVGASAQVAIVFFY